MKKLIIMKEVAKIKKTLQVSFNENYMDHLNGPHVKSPGARYMSSLDTTFALLSSSLSCWSMESANYFS
jgi:hypothetical protein